MAAALAPGCLAPTLPPLPPPRASVSEPVNGEVEVSGEVAEQDAGAMVLALNNQTGDLSGQLLPHDETRFSFKLRAQLDDVVTVFYLAHDEQSEAVNLTVRAGEEPPEGDAGSP